MVTQWFISTARGKGRVETREKARKRVVDNHMTQGHPEKKPPVDDLAGRKGGNKDIS